MESEQPIDIVMTAWRREWMTEASIHAIHQNTTTPYRLILIDSGSDQDFSKDVDVYVKLDKNYGLEYAKHIGMALVDSPLFVSTDNDILPYKYDPDWLHSLVGLIEANPNYAAIAPRPQVLVGTSGQIWKDAQEIVDFPHVPGYLRLMRTDLVRRTGAWQDKRPLRGHEEMWIGSKLKEMGYKMGWARDIRCYHLWGEESKGEDMWGYVDTESGHNPVWPIYRNDWEEIGKGVGIGISNQSTTE